jgi:hypothetical protein
MAVPPAYQRLAPPTRLCRSLSRSQIPPGISARRLSRPPETIRSGTRL